MSVVSPNVGGLSLPGVSLGARVGGRVKVEGGDVAAFTSMSFFTILFVQERLLIAGGGSIWFRVSNPSNQ